MKLITNAIEEALKDYEFEILLVNDGSTDETSSQLKKLNKKFTIAIELDKNYGQSSALAAGIDFAQGDYIVTMDGDLQNDPLDIPWMLEIMKNEKLDLITGFRIDRKDSILKKISSKIGNHIIQFITKTNIKDCGCALKIFNKNAAKKLIMNGEAHRYISIISFLNGAKIKQVPINHMPRKFGKSKYGLERVFKVIYDIILISLEYKCSNRILKSKQNNYSIKNIYVSSIEIIERNSIQFQT